MKKWNVSTLDTMAAITLDEDGLYLESLCLNGEERVIKTQIVFPKYYRAIAKDYRDTRGKKEFCWEYYSDIDIPGGVQILFRDNVAGCSLDGTPMMTRWLEIHNLSEEAMALSRLSVFSGALQQMNYFRFTVDFSFVSTVRSHDQFWCGILLHCLQWSDVVLHG